MGLLTQVRTTRLLRTNMLIGQEASRFIALIRSAFTSSSVTAVLSNYVHEEDQNFNRKAMTDTIEWAFAVAWDQALEAYEDSPEGDSVAHAHFMALLGGIPPYTAYNLHETLLSQHKREIVDRMIFLVKRG